MQPASSKLSHLILPLLAAFVATHACAEPSSGERIYQQGVGKSAIVARIADGRIQVPGTRFPCVACHKVDGLGVLEGGLKPPDITWPKLSPPLRAGGRGYDGTLLARAITQGVDAQGNELGPGMPRYAMSPSDLDGLVAYLEHLQPGSPGLTGEAIEIATLLPLQGRRAAEARAVERFLDLAVLDVNTRRRFDGRRITRRSVPFDPDVPGDALRAVESALENPPFAFLGDLGIPPSSPARLRIVAADIPEIVPLDTPLTQADRDAIWLEPSIGEQARALVQAASTGAVPLLERRFGPRKPTLAIIHSDDAESLAAAEAARGEAHKNGSVVAIDCQCATEPTFIANLQRLNVGAVLLFAPAPEVEALLNTAKRAAYRPVIFGLRTQLRVLERVSPPQADLFLVTSFGGVEPRSPGAYDFRRVVGELGGGHGDLLRDAYVGVKLLETALAVTPLPLDRHRLRETIQHLPELETGVIAPVQFGPGISRRASARVLWLDPSRGRLVPLSAWRPS